jgi:hypothetical protein
VTNKLISINTEKAPGTQLPVVVNTEIKRVVGNPGLTAEQVAELIAAATGGLQTGGGLNAAAVTALIEAAVAEVPLGLTEENWTAILEEKLTDLAPMIFQAVQSQMNALPERIRLNVKDASPNAKVVIEALNLTASGPNPNPVSMDIEVPGGNLSVNGKRVLTVDDALNAAGGSIDQAAVEAAVAAATAPLLARIAALETKLDSELANTMGYIGEQNQNLTDLHAGDMTLVGQELAKKADVTVTDGLQNQIRLNTQYIDQQVGTVIQYADLALEKKAEKSALDDLSDKYEVDLGNTRQAINDVVEFVLNNYLTKRAYQELLDAMNGPNATAESIQRMFWLLNDVLESLIAAAGIEIDGRVKP